MLDISISWVTLIPITILNSQPQYEVKKDQKTTYICMRFEFLHDIDNRRIVH